jgi:hypothetical protein
MCKKSIGRPGLGGRAQNNLYPPPGPRSDPQGATPSASTGRAVMQGSSTKNQSSNNSNYSRRSKTGHSGRLSEAAFLHDFAGDLPEARAKQLYAVQEPFRRALLAGKTTHAAWRSKPSFYAVSTEDRTITPELERFMAKRMGGQDHRGQLQPSLADFASGRDRGPGPPSRRAARLKGVARPRPLPASGA